MPAPTFDLDAAIAEMQPVFGRFPEIALAYLFGSAARGELRADSDIDIGIVFRKRGQRAADHHRLLGDLASRLDTATSPYPVDLVVLEEQGPIFCHDVLLAGRRIYDVDDERRADFESETVVRALDWRPTWNLAVKAQEEGMRRWLKEYRE